jgi:hypothetical protein
MMDKCIQVLKKLVRSCEYLIEDMEILGLDGEGYWEDMNEARQCIARAHKLFKYREAEQKVRDAFVAAGIDLGVDYSDQLTSDDRARFGAAMNACWNNNGYDSTPVDILLKEFREKYND